MRNETAPKRIPQFYGALALGKMVHLRYIRFECTLIEVPGDTTQDYTKQDAGMG